MSVAPWEEAKSAPPWRALGDVPEGVGVLDLKGHADDRGVFTEIFRQSWEIGAEPVQWNVVRSEAWVLRGIHVHPVHDDLLTVAAGRAVIGLRDLRRRSPTLGATTTIELAEESPGLIRIPHGVAHGFLFLEPSLHVYAVSHAWDPEDERLCRWDDPDLGIEWPVAQEPKLSERDASAPGLRDMIESIPATPIELSAESAASLPSGPSPSHL